MTSTWLITGARGGIGLEIVRQLSQTPSNTIIGTVRSLSGDLGSLNSIVNHPDTKARIYIAECDLTSADSINSLPSQIPSGLKIDVLLQNAAIIHPDDRDKTALTVTPPVLAETFHNNVVGPILLLQALLPSLAPGARIANVSSGLASASLISEGTLPLGNPAYAFSKAALNMFTVYAAKELAGKAVVVIVDPGWVKTQLGGSEAALEIHESAGGILRVIQGLTEADHGHFIHYDGAPRPW